MENPFVKLVREGEGDDSELAPPSRMEPEERQKRLVELREWRAKIEAEAITESYSEAMEQVDAIDKEIRRLEQE